MDHLCQEAEENIEKSEHGGLSTRLLRMKHLTLEEMRQVRDKARCGNG